MKHFREIKKTELKELNATLHELEHETSGATVIHIEADDPENVFCLSFKTVPESSDGVAHILEHTVLCGSERFPVKDPFFCMIRRSLHTFMNAFTGADFTCYPAATQVEKDFYNLLDVYMDAVFAPKLNPLSFQQEGIRLEFQNPEDPATPLEYKGIVFNEMKGALSSGPARLIEKMNEALYPDVTYGINSGGDPKVIPNLTYETLKKFHEEFYHPSRCLFFFYGNLPLEKHLEFIHEKILKSAKKLPKLPDIPRQKRFLTPKIVQASYPLPPGLDPSDKTLISLGWVTTDINNTLETLAMTVLVMILMDTDASPLKQALLNSPLCKQASYQFDTEMTEAPFIVNLKGCPENGGETLENLTLDTLKKVYKEGIPQTKIDSVIHQLELARSEIGGEGYPHGLALYFRSALSAQHGVDPEEGLLVHAVFDKLRKKLAEEPRYLEELMKKELIDNPHRALVVMTPSGTVQTEEIEAEKKTLQAILETLDDKKKQAIVEGAKKLNLFQEEQEGQDLDVLPKLTLEDVPAEGIDFELKREKIGNYDLYTHACFTNSLVYADLVYDLPQLSEEELPYLRLLSTVLPQLGAGGKDYIETLDLVQEHTGGISTALSLNILSEDVQTFTPSLHLKGKALYRKKEPFFKLLRDFATGLDWKDESRFNEIFEKHFSALTHSLQTNAIRYAMNLATSPLSGPTGISEKWFGLSYIDFIRSHKDNPLKLISPLKALYEKILAFAPPSLVITADENFLREAQKTGYWGMDAVYSGNGIRYNWEFTPKKIASQGRMIASQVAFNAKSLPGLSFADDDAPALEVVSHLFDNLTLHARIREQGGAYGGGASCNSDNGTFTFYSYRDPHIKATLDAFEEAIEKVIKGDFSDSDLEEAKLEIIQHLDSPIPPGSRGDVAYGWLRDGKSKAIREKHRTQVLKLTKEQAIEAAKKHIQPHFDKAPMVVFAGRDLIEKENKRMKEPLKLLEV
ncbi:MAG: insulinase family protein [Chlamydiia bacterium]|nr:insulinase family protein [Chlamydiia bacterium]